MYIDLPHCQFQNSLVPNLTRTRIDSSEPLLTLLRGAYGASALGGEGKGAFSSYVDWDYTGCANDQESRSRLVITFGEGDLWRSGNVQSTSQSTKDPKNYSIGGGYMRLTRIAHLLNCLAVVTNLNILSDLQCLVAIIMNRIYGWTAVPHIMTIYYLPAAIARDAEINLICMPTAEMLAKCIKKLLSKPVFLNPCAAVGMIWDGLTDGLGMGFGYGVQNGIRLVIGYVIWNANRMHIHWPNLLWGDRWCWTGYSSVTFSLWFDMNLITILKQFVRPSLCRVEHHVAVG